MLNISIFLKRTQLLKIISLLYYKMTTVDKVDWEYIKSLLPKNYPLHKSFINCA